MYPYYIFGQFDLYLICITLGAVACLFLFRLLADRVRLSTPLTNLSLGGGVAGLAAGLGTAVLFQAFYNFLAGYGFSLDKETGATFYGGLVGGIGAFLAVYFLGGRLLRDGGAYKSEFSLVSSIAACSITLAHACGRLGCFFAGCCHGHVTDAWYGVYMPAVGEKVIPTQLIEAVFLAALCAFLVFRVLRGKRDGFPVYLVAYGFFRFFIEFLRGDYRGASPVSFLTPSQFTALILTAVGMLLLLLPKKKGAEE
ncbi:MAG: prolipoprotein diacylglyceryl transferase [Clostridia bacterium]|nr:prolipoprotein diacylglyceryl transferase [Clostridia bacterium]